VGGKVSCAWALEGRKKNGCELRGRDGRGKWHNKIEKGVPHLSQENPEELLVRAPLHELRSVEFVSVPLLLGKIRVVSVLDATKIGNILAQAFLSVDVHSAVPNFVTVVQVHNALCEVVVLDSRRIRQPIAIFALWAPVSTR
jgi:hypothetical protein